MREFYVESTEKFVTESENIVLSKTMVRTVRGESLVIHGKERMVIETGEEVFAKLVGVPEETIMHIETGSLISNESSQKLQLFKETLYV